MKQTEKEDLDTFFEGIPEGGDVLLLVSPLVEAKRPLLGLHLLQASCRRVGITSYVLYSNLLYSIITGADTLSKISDTFYLFGERLFTSAAFGFSGVRVCWEKFLNPSWLPDNLSKIKPHMTKQVLEVLAPHKEWFSTFDWQYLESRTTQWVQSTTQRIVNKGYRVVGSSSTFGGLVPAIALLNSIKKADPNVITVFGGALCEEEMAEGILSLKAGIDYVFSGEGDLTFPDFVKQVLAGQLPEGKIIYGEPVTDLNTLPLPDYQDYFQQLKKIPPRDLPSSNDIVLPYETSRGCWYGKCTFCSSNGRKNFYRDKSPNKVLDDLKFLNRQKGNHIIAMTDTIMPNRYFNTLLPRIAEEIPSIGICYEIKANLKLEQVLTLKKAGVKSVQPGIESLSTPLLKKMRKGVTARENIALLRYARSVGLELSWILLFGLPGEEVTDYEGMLDLLPLIRHLPPPRFLTPVALCRFSAYQTSPGLFGISNLRPSECYEGIFPLHSDLAKVNCYFTGDFKAQSYEHPEIIIALAKEFQAWKSAWAMYKMIPLEIMLPTLHITQKNEVEYILEDTRGLPGSPERMVLNRKQASILLVSRPQDSSVDYQWAVDAQLGVLMDSWYIPLATAGPELLLEFEQDFKFDDRLF